jgi:uncharacterized GH25 family protein
LTSEQVLFMTCVPKTGKPEVLSTCHHSFLGDSFIMFHLLLRGLKATALLVALPCLSRAHDLWLQTNTPVVRTGDVVHIDCMLGNHGNDHRDFKLAGKAGIETIKNLEVILPDGRRKDIRADLADLGLAPKEGFLSTRFVTSKQGVHLVAHTSDRVVNHGTPVRSLRSAKCAFVASDLLDKVPAELKGFNRSIGHPLELVPETDLARIGPGTPITVRLLLDGKPAEGVKVSFIPRGVTLKEGTDPDYERITDKNGGATFAPKVGTYHLIVAHIEKPGKGTLAGQDYEATKYSATLSVLVPQKCPCCDD